MVHYISKAQADLKTLKIFIFFFSIGKKRKADGLMSYKRILILGESSPKIKDLTYVAQATLSMLTCSRHCLIRDFFPPSWSNNTTSSWICASLKKKKVLYLYWYIWSLWCPNATLQSENIKKLEIFSIQIYFYWDSMNIWYDSKKTGFNRKFEFLGKSGVTKSYYKYGIILLRSSYEVMLWHS